MGWSDLSISLSGPIVHSLVYHFTDRWNYIYDQKYRSWASDKYAPLEPPPSQEHQQRHRLRDVFHHGMHHMMRRDEDGEQQDSQQPNDGGANIQLTRRYAFYDSPLPDLPC